MLIGLCSLKNSPGVTTTTLALAARWPTTRPPLVVEADPAGGVLAARHGLPPNPGVVSLAAAARRGAGAELAAAHAQTALGVPVIAAPASAPSARTALTVLLTRGYPMLRAAATETGSAVLLDLGRLDPSSPVLEIARHLDMLLVLARARAEDLTCVASMIDEITAWTPQPGLALIGSGYDPAEVQQVLGVPVTATLPHDPMGASALAGARGTAPHRSALGRAALRLSHTLLAHRPTTTTEYTESVYLDEEVGDDRHRLRLGR